MGILDKIYRRGTEYLPGSVAGRLDLLRPSVRSAWGGPLNGQDYRRSMVRELASTYRFDSVVETGTFRGTGAEFFAAVFGVPVTTIEANPRFYTYSRRTLAYQNSITIVNADSRSGLRALAASVPSSETIFFYLDAHWENDLPLREELQIVAPRWKRAVVMIDDFEVPGDPGYGFDDYGPGKRLTAQYLPDEDLAGWRRFYPSLPSSEETGARRGSCVLVGPDLLVSDLSTLRPA